MPVVSKAVLAGTDPWRLRREGSQTNAVLLPPERLCMQMGSSVSLTCFVVVFSDHGGRCH